MAKGIRIGVNNAPREVKKIYVGVNGTVRKVKEVYVGVAGIARKVWSAYGFDKLTKLANPVVLPSSPTDVSFSPDGTYLVITQDASPYLLVYKRDGDTYTRITGMSAPLAYTTVNFSSDNLFMVVSTASSSEYSRHYKRSGDTFTLVGEMGTPGVRDKCGREIATRSQNGIIRIDKHNGVKFSYTYNYINDAAINASFGAMSQDDTYMCVAGDDGREDQSSLATIYKQGAPSSYNYSKIGNLTGLYGTYCTDAIFSPDNNYLMVIVNSVYAVQFYKRSGDNFVFLNRYALPIAAAGDASLSRVSVSGDGEYWAVTYNISPFFTVFKRNGDALSVLPNAAVLPTNRPRGISINPVEAHLAVVNTNGTFLNIYKG